MRSGNGSLDCQREFVPVDVPGRGKRRSDGRPHTKPIGIRKLWLDSGKVCLGQPPIDQGVPPEQRYNATRGEERGKRDPDLARHRPTGDEEHDRR